MAEVTLADIPLSACAMACHSACWPGMPSFNETVEAARAALAPPRLVLNLAQRSITAGSTTVELPPAELHCWQCLPAGPCEASQPYPHL